MILSRRLILAVLALADSSLAAGSSTTSSSPSPVASAFLNPSFCAVPIGNIDDACGATYEAVESTNNRIRPIIKELVKTDFFRFYYLDLYGNSCPFGDDSATCANRNCAVDTLEDEKDLPEIWKASNLGKLSKDTVSSSIDDEDDDIELSCVKNADNPLAQGGRLEKQIAAAWDKSCKDKNYCVPEDDRTGPNGVYVSLLDNPERYTGYAGPHAHMIWRSAYQQNCFGYTGPSLSKSFLKGNEPSEEKNLKKDYLTEDNTDVNKDQEMCMEQRLFYRLISGMHSSVSTHLCYSDLNKTTGEWGPNLSCFLFRVGNHPERLSNLYFNYAVVSRAIAKLSKYVDDLQFCPNSKRYDQATRQQILLLARSVSSKSPEIFDESKVFSTPEAKVLKEEFRQRFLTVSSLMDCIGCDRCRLWGKLQAAGYGTALKLVLELNETEDEQSRKLIASLRRSELVSLINTYDRLSKSIEAVVYFRNMVQEQLKNEATNANSSQKKHDKGPEQGHWADSLRSYIEYPKNLYKLGLDYTSQYWNPLVKKDNTNTQKGVGKEKTRELNEEL